MSKIWIGLKFIGRWLGPAFLVLAVWLFLFPISPFGHNAALPALIGAIITALACIFMRAPERKRQRKILAVCALTAFAYVGWSNWEEKRGFHTQAVSFENRGARLAGTLYLPDRPGKDRLGSRCWANDTRHECEHHHALRPDGLRGAHVRQTRSRGIDWEIHEWGQRHLT